MAIKPEYVELILNGDKWFEYRRVMPQKDVDKILIYETAPVSRVVGEAEVLTLVSACVDDLWKWTWRFSGIFTYKEYLDYFAGCKQAYAYRLGKVRKYKTPYTLEDLHIARAPQSFCYLPDDYISGLF